MSELTDLIGKRRLDAVDFEIEKVHEWGDRYVDASVCRFRLDGVVYVAIEDPSDGYRSSMRDLFIPNDKTVKNVFPAIEVVGKHRTVGSYSGKDDVLELIDAVTGKVVLEVGTDNIDDYYPGFVASFHPENMATNADIVAEEAAAKEAAMWTPWSGGECPVDESVLVQIRADFDPDEEPVPASNWLWDHDRPKRDCITAYRVVAA